MDMLIALYLRDKYLISLYSVKTFESRRVIRIKKFIIRVIMRDLRLEKHNPCGNWSKFHSASDYGNNKVCI